MAKAKAQISIVERRLQSGSIFSASSLPIPLKEPKRWTLRIVNTLISDAHLWEMQAQKGWVYASPDDLAVDPVELGFRVQDGRVVRGTKGTEVLMKMETADYQSIRQHKDAENRKNTFGAKAVKRDILAAAAREPDGDRGADFLNRAVQSVQVKDSVERVSLED